MDLTKTEAAELGVFTAHNKEEFTKNAPIYDLAMLLLPEEHHTIVQIAQLSPGHRVLDIGCGTGTLALLCLQEVGNSGIVVGLDVSPAMIQAAQKKDVPKDSTILFRVADCFLPGMADKAKQLGSGDGRDGLFDRIIVHRIIGYMPQNHTIQGKVFAMWAKLLAPGGKLIFDFCDPDNRLPNAVMISPIPGRSKPDAVVERFTVHGGTDIADTIKSAKDFVKGINATTSLKFKGTAFQYHRTKAIATKLGLPPLVNKRADWLQLTNAALAGKQATDKEVNEKMWTLLNDYGKKQQREKAVLWDCQLLTVVCVLELTK
jgi:SAM-dependent methyltransferase